MRILYSIAIAGFLLASCGQGRGYGTVPVDEYRDLKSCWQYGRGIRAIFVMAVDEGDLVPYFISPFCNAVVPGYPPRSGFTALYRAIRLSGNQDSLQKAAHLSGHLISNTYSHISTPTGDGELGLLSTELVPENGSDPTSYIVGPVHRFCRTSVTIKRYEAMTDQERLAFALNGCPSSGNEH